MTSTQYGILTGPAFTALFAVGGLFAGYCSDNSNRKRVIAYGCLVWSLACAAMGLSNAYWQVLLARFVLAFSQAFSPALSYSMIADWFSVEHRATANGFFASGVYLGYGITSLSLLVLPSIGWRIANYISGAFGIVSLAMFIVLVREPERNASSKPPVPERNSADVIEIETKPSVWSRFSTLIKSFWQLMKPTDMILISVAGALRMLGGLVLGAYLPPYMKKYFPDLKNQFSLTNSIVVVVSGLISSSFGGRITDYWSKRTTRRLTEAVLRGEYDHEFDASPALDIVFPHDSATTLDEPLLHVQTTPVSDVHIEDESEASIPASESPSTATDSPPIDLTPFALTPAIGNLLMTPLLVAVFLIPNLYAAMSVLFLAYIVGESWYAPLFAIIQNGSLHPKHLKGSAIALLIFSISILSSPGTVIVGAVDDELHSVRWETMIGTAAPIFVSGLIFLIVARNQRRSFIKDLVERKRNGTLHL